MAGTTRRELLTQGALLPLSIYALTAAESARAQADRASQWPPPGAGAKEVPVRTPRYPLKEARGLFTDTEIAQARQNTANSPEARKLKESICKGADTWLDWTDDDLVRLLSPAQVPRAFDVGASVGCPKCGQTIHEKFGTYPWTVDLRKPFKLICPVDGTVYPDNDYAAYKESGFKEKHGWDQPIVDDGWGWLNPKNGERYWFVAHWNHRVYHRHIGPGVVSLGRAYLLTGDKKYAHKAAVMLYRLAEVYPAMDHEHQSRYGLLSAARGIRYPGKVLNHIWETAFVVSFAEAYDAVWDSIDGDTELQKRTGKNGREIRAFIEANLLEDAVDAYFADKLAGNFGMHQNALAHLALSRQKGDTRAWLTGLLDGSHAPSSAPAYLGINYALYDLVFRDGVPSESSPGYNFLWVAKLTDIARLFQRSGLDLFQSEPRLRRMYDAVLDLINTGTYMPSLGDSGSVWGDTTGGRNQNVFLTAWRAYDDPRYARFVAGKGDALTFETLLLPPAPRPEALKTAAPKPSRLLDGSGIGVLCDPKDKVSATITYGWKAGHGHFDRLNVELFAAGVPLMPDLGYPDAMNDYVSGIYTWSKNTVAHNTVVVDDKRQLGNVPGRIRHFAAEGFARVLDVDAAGTYPEATAYRRTLLMVDAGENSYLLDVFAVNGGTRHDYSLHGPPGVCETQGAAAWAAPEPGTLAGANISLGVLYDDPTMGAAGYKGGYSGYTGSGFQHLAKVRRKGEGDDWRVEWQHAKKPEARLRIRTLPQEGQEVLLAEARVSPVGQPDLIRYLIARRNAAPGEKNLSSRFVSVIEPFVTTPFIEATRPLPLTVGKGVVVEVRRTGGETDLLVYDLDAAEKKLTWEGTSITTNATAAVLTRNAAGQFTRLFLSGRPEGATLHLGDKEYKASGLSATIDAVDLIKRTVRLKAADREPTSLIGRTVSIANERRSAAFTVAAAQREADGAIMLTLREDLAVGRAPVKKIAGSKVTVGVALPLAATYPGAAVYTEGSGMPCGLVNSATTDGIELVSGAETSRLKLGSDLWLAHAAPGDRLELPAQWAKDL